MIEGFVIVVVKAILVQVPLKGTVDNVLLFSKLHFNSPDQN